MPEWHRGNYALWDSITGIMYFSADVTIIYKPESKKAEELALEIDKIVGVFIEASHDGCGRYNE